MALLGQNKDCSPILWGILAFEVLGKSAPCPSLSGLGNCNQMSCNVLLYFPHNCLIFESSPEEQFTYVNLFKAIILPWDEAPEIMIVPLNLFTW